jgi:uncharacterized damage-inducible protein DinB
MYNRSYYEMMADYNYWMNQKLYAICAEIPDEKRKENLGAFFQSIHGTLNHLLFEYDNYYRNNGEFKFYQRIIYSVE